MRGRAGWITNETLLFAAFGAAMGDINAYDSIETTGRGRKTKVGWTAGGGIERRINAQWSLKLEYLYLDFGTGQYFTLSNRTPEEVSLQTSVVRAGLNFRF
jgi:outer membrane immunogenic protein